MVEPLSTRLLLDDRLAPITTTIGLVRAPVEDVADSYERAALAYLAKSNPQAKVKRASPRGDLEEVLRSLLPLSTASTRELFVPVSGEWTATFDNGFRGPDPRGVTSIAVADLRRPGLVAMLDPMEISGVRRPTAHPGGALGFILYDADVPSGMHERRSVIVSQQGSRGHDFDASGDPLPFEDLSAYERRRVRDRMPLELLTQYLRGLGVNPLDEGAYEPGRAVWFETRYPRYKPPTFSLEQAQAAMT